MKRFLIPLLVYFVSTLVGCANPGVIQVSPDTYMLSREDHAGIFGNAGSLRAGVISDANNFAASQNKIAIPISSQFTPTAPGRFASFEYQFRVVNKDDPEARRTALMPRADMVVEQKQKINANVSVESVKSNDLYTDLLKLEDLRKKGILSKTEFEAQKKILLEGKK